MKKEHLVLKTFLAVVTMIFFSTLAGASVMIGKLSGARAKYSQAFFLILSTIAVILFYLISKKNLVDIGFCKVEKGKLKNIYYAIPLLIISLSALIGGIGQEQLKMFFANLLLALTAGFSEEIYYRGIIYHLWMKKGIKYAVFISAILFSLVHSLNMLGGADIGYTILQVSYTFFNGIVFAILMLLTESIWPCIMLHSFHDACSFMGNDIPQESYTLVFIIWVLILLLYIFLMRKQIKKAIELH